MAHPPPDSVYNMMNLAGAALTSPRSSPPAALGAGGAGDAPHFDAARPPEWIDAPYGGGGGPAQAHAQGFWTQDYAHPAAAAYAIAPFAAGSPPPLPPPPPPPLPPTAAVTTAAQFADTPDQSYLAQLPLNATPSAAAMAPIKGDPHFADRHSKLHSRRCTSRRKLRCDDDRNRNDAQADMAVDLHSGFSYAHNPMAPAQIGVQTTTEQSFETTIAYPTTTPPPPMPNQYHAPPPFYHSQFPPHIPSHFPPQPSPLWGHGYAGGPHAPASYYHPPHMPELATSVPIPALAHQGEAKKKLLVKVRMQGAGE